MSRVDQQMRDVERSLARLTGNKTQATQFRRKLETKIQQAAVKKLPKINKALVKSGQAGWVNDPGGSYQGVNLAAAKPAGGSGEPNAKNGYQQENADQYDGELEQRPLHSPSGTQGILGGSEQSAATLPYLHQDEQDQHN